MLGIEAVRFIQFAQNFAHIDAGGSQQNHGNRDFCDDKNLSETAGDRARRAGAARLAERSARGHLRRLNRGEQAEHDRSQKGDEECEQKRWLIDTEPIPHLLTELIEIESRPKKSDAPKRNQQTSATADRTNEQTFG